jgi:small subunit ribosomal protein S8
MDTLANMLNGIKTAGFVKKASIVIPHSKLKAAVLEVLKKEGYIKTYSIVEGTKPSIEVVLAYKDESKGKAPRIGGVARVSKPSKRVYTGAKDIASVKYGHGTAVLSTPKGIMTGKEARKEQVGGELLFTIW